MVRIHSQVLSDTPSSRDRVVGGTPRLDTTAIKDPDSTVSTRSRRRSEGTSSAPMGSANRSQVAQAVAAMEVSPLVIRRCHRMMTPGND